MKTNPNGMRLVVQFNNDDDSIDIRWNDRLPDTSASQIKAISNAENTQALSDMLRDNIDQTFKDWMDEYGTRQEENERTNDSENV